MTILSVTTDHLHVGAKSNSQKHIKDQDQDQDPLSGLGAEGRRHSPTRPQLDHGRSRGQARGSVDGAAARRGEQNRDGAASPTCLHFTYAVCAAVTPCCVDQIETARPVRPAYVCVLVCACVHVCACVRACVYVAGFWAADAPRRARPARCVHSTARAARMPCARTTCATTPEGCAPPCAWLLPQPPPF